MLLIGAALLLFTLLMLWLGFASRSGVMLSIWMLGGFLLRNFWFIGFALGQRAATPGKRLLGIRYVAADGGRTAADTVVARNHIRERTVRRGSRERGGRRPYI